MSELRERLETLFTKHHHCYEPCQDVLDALVAMWPQPSREGLEQLLDNHTSHGLHTMCENVKPLCWCVGLAEKVVAWAQGSAASGTTVDRCEAASTTTEPMTPPLEQLERLAKAATPFCA